ncbi:MAG: FAD-binding oxidoreductase [Alphaproteobacteria bacterium]|nr:FAD-binding oxidoreductase [Alphaproteobacteria bacterium]
MDENMGVDKVSKNDSIVLPTPYWWDDAGVPLRSDVAGIRPHYDAVIIGAGLTGLSTAITLAKHDYAVLVLDQHSIGWGASGRNGGMVGGGHRLSHGDMAKLYGAETATAMMMEAHHASLAHLKQTIKDNNIDCDFSNNGRFRGFYQQHEYQQTADSFAAINDWLGLEYSMVKQQEVRDIIASDIYHGGIIFHQHCSFNPMKYIKGLYHTAIKLGVDIATQAIFLNGDHQGEKSYVSFVVDGDNFHRINCKHIVMATNGYTHQQSGCKQNQFLRQRILSIPSFIVALKNIGQYSAKQLIPSGHSIVETRAKHCYYRLSPDKSHLIFGARAAFTNRPASVINTILRKFIAEIFPDIAHGQELLLTHHWRGLTGFSFDATPHIGKHDGFWYAMGYSGNGNTMAPYLGHKLALQIIGKHEGNSAFSQNPLPKPRYYFANINFSNFWWHRGWFLPFADIFYRLKDMMQTYFSKKK